jgi:hypothetical protein
VGVTPLVNNLVAGLQIAISQPIRLDDVVVVDGYWGRIEEIRLTYVVIRVWDLKRLMVPISYLTQNPFENWTRFNATVLGYVYIETVQLRALMSSPDSSASWNLQCEVRERALAFLQERYPIGPSAGADRGGLGTRRGRGRPPREQGRARRTQAPGERDGVAAGGGGRAPASRSGTMPVACSDAALSALDQPDLAQCSGPCHQPQSKLGDRAHTGKSTIARS